jgi:hypothetical protein
LHPEPLFDQFLLFAHFALDLLNFHHVLFAQNLDIDSQILKLFGQFFHDHLDLLDQLHIVQQLVFVLMQISGDQPQTGNYMAFLQGGLGQQGEAKGEKTRGEEGVAEAKQKGRLFFGGGFRFVLVKDVPVRKKVEFFIGHFGEEFRFESEDFFLLVVITYFFKIFVKIYTFYYYFFL